MKTTTTYSCEVCDTEYKDKEVAEHCETFMPLAESPIHIGDTVYCESRYDGFFELKVTGIAPQATLTQRTATLEKRVCKSGQSKGQELTGSYESVLNLAHIFEDNKIRYTVSLVGCVPTEKPNAGFQYWVTELFPKQLSD